MKVHISYGFKKGAWGGANQFLKNLKTYLISKNIYESSPNKANVIIINSYPFREEWRFREIIKLKQLNKIIVHRIDGPLSIVRGDKISRIYDEIAFIFNQLFADATIFQSKWSKMQNYASGLRKNRFETIIMNGTDPTIFKFNQRIINNEKIRIIASSWSKNIKKGFQTYKYIDENLDFSKFKMDFIGKSPMKFRNIKQFDPVPTTFLSKKLNDYHIFITASIDDPCSNSLIEAISSGLVILAINSGGHPEILEETKSGILFENETDVLQKLEELIRKYDKISQQIRPLTIQKTGKKYLDFIHKVKPIKHSTIKSRSKFYINYFLKKSQLNFERIFNSW